MDDRTEQHTRGESMRQWALLGFAIVLLTAGAVYAALAVAVRVDAIFFPGNSLVLPGPLARVPGLDSGPVPDSVLSDRINILILGLDRRPHHDPAATGPSRSDSIYVLSIDPVMKTAGLLAIPRDLYVHMPNPEGKSVPWQTRINTAYQYGSYYKYPGGGPGLARETVEQTLRIKIQYHIVIDWVGFAEIIDALGGVEITVPEPLRDVEAFNVRTFDTARITIPAGRQTMNSYTALAYARYRGDQGGDLSRIRRQQQVMQAAVEKALTLGWLANAPALWSRYRGAFETDIGTARLPGLVALARQIGADRVTMVSLAGEHGEAVQELRTAYGEDVLVPVWERAVPIIQSVVYDRRLREEGALVRVLNSSGLQGQAARVAEHLTRSGLTPADVSVAEAPPGERRAETLIVDYAGKDYTARRLMEWLGLPRSSLQRRDGSGRAPGEPDIVVLVGADLKLIPDTPVASRDGR